ncbi:hypothetical protein M9Y10_007468 [Tritrichomonas musculus]|uniref:Uncharacterized protein n=1 Tax=Tritrichomonas musculus TaxID=1915356 RepID=A0ABR2J1E8_9EUKA
MSFNFFEVFNFYDLNGGIWRSIIERMLDLKASKKGFKITNIEYNYGKEMNGIIKFLISQKSGDMEDSNTVKVSASSTQKVIRLNQEHKFF